MWKVRARPTGTKLSTVSWKGKFQARNAVSCAERRYSLRRPRMAEAEAVTVTLYVCDGFPTIPAAACHKTIASVLLHSCEDATFKATLEGTYDPRLPDCFRGDLPDGVTIVEDWRNIFHEHAAVHRHKPTTAICDRS